MLPAQQPSWIVYNDPLLNGKVLMGYKGNSYMDAGYFYAPYVPITQTPVVLDPDTAISRRGILTRYGKKMLSKKLLSKMKKYRSIKDPWQPSQEQQEQE